MLSLSDGRRLADDNDDISCRPLTIDGCFLTVRLTETGGDSLLLSGDESAAQRLQTLSETKICLTLV